MGVCLANKRTLRLGVRVISFALLLGFAAGAAQAKTHRQGRTPPKKRQPYTQSDCSRHFATQQKPLETNQVRVYLGDARDDFGRASVLEHGVLLMGPAEDHEIAEAIDWMSAYREDPNYIGGDLLKGYDPDTVVFILTAGSERGVSVPGFDGVLAYVAHDYQNAISIEPIARVSLKATFGDQFSVSNLLDKGIDKSRYYAQDRNWDRYSQFKNAQDRADFQFLKRLLAIGIKDFTTLWVIHAPNATVARLRSACNFINKIANQIKSSFHSPNRMSQVSILSSQEALVIELATRCRN